METFYKKRVLVTGHSGFKGSWASVLLDHLGAEVFGASIDVPSDSKHVYHEYSVGSRVKLGESHSFDVADRRQVQGLFENEKFEFIFHFAAQAIVSTSIEDPMRTFETNVIGLGNVLHLARLYQPSATIILVTSDKCYEPKPQALPYVESHTMGGDDPYSGSKAAAEILYSSLIRTYKTSSWPYGVGTVRAGNVFGGGDWSPNRLAPDLVRDASVGKPTTLRLPDATRPWTYVLDIVYGYLLLAQKLRAGQAASGESWNFASGERLTVREFAEKLSSDLGGRIASDSREKFEEVGFLELDASKAKGELGWSPLFSLEEALKLTSSWYANPSDRKDELKYLEPYLQILQSGD